MRDIVLLVGLSSSGKDYLSKQLVNKGFNNMVSYTTRPPRKGEKDGVEYHFIKSNEEFESLVDSGEIFEMTEYHTVHGSWWYGYGNKSLPPVGEQKNVAIVNPHGIQQFLESDIRDRVVVVDIHSPNHMRLEQICNRYGGIDNMSDKEMCEAFRREVEDAKPFYEYFNDDSTEINWSKLFEGIPFIAWIHNYDGNIDSIYKNINSMLEVGDEE